MEDPISANIKRTDIVSFIQHNHWPGTQARVPDGTSPVERVEIIPNESGEQETFDESIDPAYFDEGGARGGTAAPGIQKQGASCNLSAMDK